MEQVTEVVEISDVSPAFALARRAAVLRATADTVRLRIGELVSSAALPLTMVDSAGAVLGPLPIYDTQMEPAGVVEPTETGWRAMRAGVQRVTFRIPQPFRAGLAGPAPGAVLHFRVVP